MTIKTSGASMCSAAAQLARKARGQTKFFKDSRDEYGNEFMSDVDRACLIIDDYQHLERVSKEFLSEYIGSNNRWDKAAAAASKYGKEIRSQENNNAFEGGNVVFQKLGQTQAQSAAVIMEKFNNKLHGFVQADLTDMLTHLKRLESLRKEMEKTAKKAGKKEDDAVLKTTAAQAKETHDTYVPKVAENMKTFIAAAVMLKGCCESWIEAETTLIESSKKIIDSYKG